MQDTGNTQVFTQELIERAIRSDSMAQTTLYNATYNPVYALVKSMVKEEDTVLDIVQDSYVKAFSNLHQLQEADKFRPWVKKIAKNRTMDYFRERKAVMFSAMAPLDAEDAEVEFEDTDPRSLPEVVIDRQETARLLKEILDDIPDDQRAIISMHYYGEMSVREIAQELGLNEATVKSRLRYGKQKIETKVLDLEKRGTKIYGLAAIPFLVLLLRNSEAYAMEPDAAAGCLQRIFGRIGAGAGHVVTSGAGAGAGMGAGHLQGAPGAAMAGAGHAQNYAAQATGLSGVGSVAGTAAGTAAKGGLPLAVKILIGAAAAVVIGAGAFFVIPAVTSRNDTPARQEVQAEPRGAQGTSDSGDAAGAPGQNDASQGDNAGGAPSGAEDAAAQEDSLLAPVLDELTQFAALCEQESYEEIQTLLHGASYDAVYELFDGIRDQMPVMIDTAHGRVGVYYMDRVPRDAQIALTRLCNYMLYWGDWADGDIRQGEGVWAGSGYLDVGTWDHDVPEGSHMSYKYVTSGYYTSYRDESFEAHQVITDDAGSEVPPRLYATLTGSVTNGLWNGTMRMNQLGEGQQGMRAIYDATYNMGMMNVVHVDNDRPDGRYCYYFALQNIDGEPYKFSVSDFGFAYYDTHGIRGYAGWDF
ncbi:MAG: RNA polymerase sigma factor [Lachnospiraceae bacterium]|nr:RNA polymerase sigma factor [Lachnospiraceae bacterium]